jgi:hypothetical protein
MNIGQSRIQIEPDTLSIGDLLSPDTQVKSTREGSGQRLAFKVSHNPVCFLILETIFPDEQPPAWDVKFLEEVAPNQFEASRLSYKRPEVAGVGTAIPEEQEEE